MTPQDLKQIRNVIQEETRQFTTKDDLIALEKRFERRFATKFDLKNMGDSIVEDVANVIKDFALSVDEKKADRNDVEKLNKRVKRIEEVFPQQ